MGVDGISQDRPATGESARSPRWRSVDVAMVVLYVVGMPGMLLTWLPWPTAVADRLPPRPWSFVVFCVVGLVWGVFRSVTRGQLTWRAARSPGAPVEVQRPSAEARLP